MQLEKSVVLSQREAKSRLKVSEKEELPLHEVLPYTGMIENAPAKLEELYLLRMDRTADMKSRSSSSSSSSRSSRQTIYKN
tara:strand:- start:2962 stop:3204 length:243 start_codon:yes stop_codon:yes gene_type:complete